MWFICFFSIRLPSSLNKTLLCLSFTGYIKFTLFLGTIKMYKDPLGHNSQPLDSSLGWWMILLWTGLGGRRMGGIDRWGSGYPIVAHLVAVVVVQNSLQTLDAVSLIQLIGRQQVHFTTPDTFVLGITCWSRERRKTIKLINGFNWLQFKSVSLTFMCLQVRPQIASQGKLLVA